MTFSQRTAPKAFPVVRRAFTLILIIFAWSFYKTVFHCCEATAARLQAEIGLNFSLKQENLE